MHARLCIISYFAPSTATASMMSSNTTRRSVNGRRETQQPLQGGGRGGKTPATPSASALTAPVIRHLPRIEERRQRGAQSGVTQRGGVGQRPPLLPPFRPPALVPAAASTTRDYSVDNHKGSQFDESQPLLSPPPPLPLVTANTRQTVVESQLTTMSGLGDGLTSDKDEEKKEEDREESVERAREKSVATANARWCG